MASTSKRAWKLQEFVAHAGTVNCLALGHKSGRVLVTGGDDRKVNTWAVGKPTCIMSLAGHSNPVEAVRFGHAEEMVIAGSMSGVLKIWDLEAAKIVRTLSGHKANIKCLDFHPYGDFVASGSSDTNLKIWDIRRKGCLFTYKGHTDAVQCLRFSPDGRWIVSGSADSTIKLWDLTAGKQVSEFTAHRGPVNAIEFHPNEFLLASGSSDRTCRFWDLETFDVVSTTEEESGPVRAICFQPEGTCFYSAGENSLRVYSWEPAKCIDSLAVGWGKVAAIAVAESSKQSQLIGASFSQTNVSTFVVDLHRQGDTSQPSVNNCPTPRKSFVTERPPTQCSKPVNIPKSEPCQDQLDVDDDLDQNIAHIKNEDAYEQIFSPRHSLAHSPTNTREPFPDPDVDMKNLNLKDKQWRQVNPSEAKAASVKPPAQAPYATPLALQQPVAPAPQSMPPPQIGHAPPVGLVAPCPPQPPISVAKAVDPVLQVQPPPMRPAPPGQNYDHGLDAGINPDAFLPTPVVQKPKSEAENEQSIVKSIFHGHDSMVTVLSNRSRNLDVVRALWTSGSVRTAFDSAVNMNDQAVIVDLLNIMSQKPSLWNLDLCAVVLVQVNKLLTSKYENYVLSACSSVRLVLKNFSAVIKTNVGAPPPAGVDLCREERYDKCYKCYAQLMDVKMCLTSKSQNSGKLGTTFRELILMLNLLD